MTSELQALIGTTFKRGAYSVRLDVADDYDASTDDADCYTTRQIAAFKTDDWQYVGVIAKVSLDGIELGRASLWCIERGWYPLTDENDNLTVDPVEYLDVYDEAISDTIDEAIDDARSSLARLCAKAREELAAS